MPQKEIDIDGRAYRLTLLPSTLGRPMLLRLSQLLSQGADRASLLNSDAGMLTGAVLALTESELEKTWGAFEARTEIMASEGFIPLSMEFPKPAGLTDYGLMMDLLEAHVDANFASFFAKARAKLQAARAKTTSESPKK